jgi:plastocyanin
MKQWKSLLIIAFALITAVSMPACSKDDDNDSPDNNNNNNGGQPTVTMQGDMFRPANLEVPIGTTVTWNNDDNDVHTVTADNGSFNSGDLDPGDTYTYTFSQQGTFSYHCQHHAGMVGTVTVIAL